MELLSGKSVKKAKETETKESEDRVARLTKEETDITRRLNTLKVEEHRKLQIKETEAGQKESLMVTKSVLEIEVTDLERRKKIALQPVLELEKEAQKAKVKLDKEYEVVAKKSEQYDINLEALQERTEDITDKEAEIEIRENETRKKHVATVAVEKELKTSTEKLSQFWSKYHIATNALNVGTQELKDKNADFKDREERVNALDTGWVAREQRLGNGKEELTVGRDKLAKRTIEITAQGKANTDKNEELVKREEETVHKETETETSERELNLKWDIYSDDCEELEKAENAVEEKEQSILGRESKMDAVVENVKTREKALKTDRDAARKEGVQREQLLDKREENINELDRASLRRQGVLDEREQDIEWKEGRLADRKEEIEKGEEHIAKEREELSNKQDTYRANVQKSDKKTVEIEEDVLQREKTILLNNENLQKYFLNHH